MLLIYSLGGGSGGGGGPLPKNWVIASERAPWSASEGAYLIGSVTEGKAATAKVLVDPKLTQEGGY